MKKLLIFFAITLAIPYLAATDAPQNILKDAGIAWTDLSSKGQNAIKALGSAAKPIDVLRTAGVTGNMYGEDMHWIDPRWMYNKSWSGTTKAARKKLETALAAAAKKEEEDKKAVPATTAGGQAVDPQTGQAKQSLRGKVTQYAGLAIAMISVLRLLYYTTRSTRKRAIALFALKKFFSPDFAYKVSLMSPIDQMVIARAQKRMLWGIAGMLVGGGAMIAGRYV